MYVTKYVHDTIKIATSKVSTTFTGDSTFDEHSGHAELKVAVIKGKTRAECFCDSLVIAKKLAIRDTVHHIIKETAKVKTEIKFMTSPFDRFCRWFFIACCCAVGLYVGAKIAKV